MAKIKLRREEKKNNNRAVPDSAIYAIIAGDREVSDVFKEYGVSRQAVYERLKRIREVSDVFKEYGVSRQAVYERLKRMGKGFPKLRTWTPRPPKRDAFLTWDEFEDDEDYEEEEVTWPR